MEKKEEINQTNRLNQEKVILIRKSVETLVDVPFNSSNTKKRTDVTVVIAQNDKKNVNINILDICIHSTS